MSMLILLSILINLMMPVMIYVYVDISGFFIEFVLMYVFTNLILNYIIYQRLNIRRLENKNSYKKLFTLGYDLKSIKKYSKKEIFLFYLTLFMCISIYLLTLSISLILKEVLPLKALFICLAYIIPMTVMYLITDYKEGRSVLSWKKS